MHKQTTVWCSLVTLVVVGIVFVANSGQAPAAGMDVMMYLGRWDLTLKGPDAEYPSWIELTEEHGQLKASFVGRWGSARPLPKVDVKDLQLMFVSPKENEGLAEDMVFAGKLLGTALEGIVNGANGQTWTWTGVRAPALKESQASSWGRPVPLFDGKSLSGWKMMPPEGKPAWTVKGGALVKPPNGPELINELMFNNFKLHLEFNCGRKANSGVYLRGRYEVQIETDSSGAPPSHHTGAVYGFIAAKPEAPRTPDLWQTFDITLLGRYVTVVLNGRTIIDQQEIPGITGGALDSHEGMEGPIYLQGSEGGKVLYRNIVITPGW
jgi:Domain of Unknown Function (DUF1080)